MVLEGIVRATSGPFPVKLALAIVLVAVFLYLRRRETEGAMAGYASIALFLALRDAVFAFAPIPDLFRASDLVLFGAMLLVVGRSFGAGWRYLAPLAVAGLALAALLLKTALGVAAFLPSELLHLAAVVPAVASALVPLIGRSGADSQARALADRTGLPIAAGSLAYLAIGAVLGPSDPIYQGLVVPLFYGLLLSIGFAFMGIVHRDLVSAVDYYEESVDSLYDLLSATGAAMKPDFSMQDLLDSMLQSMVERSGADGGIILLADEFEDSISVRSLRGRYPPPFKLPESLPKSQERVEAFLRHARFKLGEGLLGEVAQTGKHVFASGRGDMDLPDNGDEEWIKPGGLIVSPLIVRDRIIGAVSVATSAARSFTERDFDRCKLLANFGSIAVASSFSFLEAAERGDIEREAAIAEGVQRSIAPKALPELPGLAFAAFTSPARGVCSDYYDVIQTRADRAVLAIGDVAGKGVAASLVIVMIQSILHLITNSTKDAATLLQWVNRGITGRVDLDHYATLGLMAVDASSGRIEFANAGHQPLLVYRRGSDSIETVEMKSVPIGVERSTEYARRAVAFGPGDVLVAYTDGIVEAMNDHGRQYGRKNLGNVVQRCHDLPAKEIAERIRADLDDFAGQSRQHDDQTVLVMKSRR